MSAHVYGVQRPKPGPQETLVQLGKGEFLDCVILSTAIWGVGTHWNDRAGKHGRSERCTIDKGECSGHEGKLPYRWKGYLYVYCFTRRRGVFVELTPGAGELVETQARPGEPLRGQRLKLRRGQGGEKTRIHVEVTDYHGDHETLPPDRDPEPILETLWNWRR